MKKEYVVEVRFRKNLIKQKSVKISLVYALATTRIAK